MEKKIQMDCSILKHTGKSVMSDMGSKKVAVRVMPYDNNMTLYAVLDDAYGVNFETTDKQSVSVTITKGGRAIKVMDYQEFVDKLLKE